MFTDNQDPSAKLPKYIILLTSYNLTQLDARASKGTVGATNCRASSTYHHLCCEHVFVPKLEVPHFLQDHFLIFPGLEEVCTTEHCGEPEGFVPLNVDSVWLVIGVDSPGRKKQLLPFPI